MASSSVENLEMHKKGPNISSQRHLAPLGKLVTMVGGIKQLFCAVRAERILSR